jgi:Bacterial Ig-like domain (group 3)
MFKHTHGELVSRSPARRERATERKRRMSLTPLVEALEGRVVPSTVTWDNTNHPTGGDWDTVSNWIGGKVPTAVDTAVINLTGGTVTHDTTAVDSVLSLSTNATTTVSLSNGSLAIGNAISTINNNLSVSGGGALTLGGSTVTGSGALTVAGHLTTATTGTATLAMSTVTISTGSVVSVGNLVVANGTTMNVGSNVGFTLQGGQTLTDNGVVNFNSGDAVTLVRVFNTTTQFIVNGALSASGTSFVISNSPSSSSAVVQVNSGGHLTASNSTFAVDQLTLSNGSVLNPGDLTGDGFDLPISVPFSAVPLLANNRRFRDINILNGTLPSPQSLALNAIGTDTAANLRFVFPAGFTVASGATINVGANVNLVIGGGQTFTDSGAMSFSTGDTVTFVRVFNATTQFTVNGALSASGTSFVVSNSPSSSSAVIQVNSGGHLTASNGTFALDQLTLNNGSVLNPGDLTGDGFDQTITVPFSAVPLLTNNRRFQDVNIQNGTFPSPQTLALNAIGTDTTANLRFVFIGGFTVASGATINVGPNVTLVIGGGQSFINNGVINFSTGDNVIFVRVFNSTTQFVVNGALNASGTSFVISGSPSSSSAVLQVNSGGHLTAADSTFAVDQLTLGIGSVLNSGDLTTNGFDLPISVPFTDVPLLTNNRRFRDINILTGNMTAGQTLALNPIGTDAVANLRYVFSAGFTVASGATVNVGANVAFAVQGAQAFTDNGALNFANGSSVNVVRAFNTITQIVVNGALTAAGVNFFNSGNGSSSTNQIQVNSGGHFNLSGGSFSLDTLNLLSGAAANMTGVVYSGQLAINSAATVAISGNDFTNVPAAGVIASGDPSATIPLPKNYWGTTNTTQIAAKIKDHVTDAARPTINFVPFAGGKSGVNANNVITTYNAAAHSISLGAAVSSPSGVVSEGTVTFTVFDNATQIGSIVSSGVVGGLTSASFSVPAGTIVGSYLIQAAYVDDSGSGSPFASSSDSSHLLTINRASTTTTATNVTATFSASAAQSLSLSANITSAGGSVGEGTATFTVLNGVTIIGAPVAVNVSAGAANATYSLPANTHAGTYVVQVAYVDLANYQSSNDVGHHLTVNQALTTAAANNASANYSTLAQTIQVVASVSSSAGTVNEGTVTFTLSDGVNVIGNPIAASVQNGVATTNYVLPPGLLPGAYPLKAAFNGSNDFLPFTDNSHQLTITAAATTTTGANATATFNTTNQLVALTATVLSGSSTVNEGVETFTIFNGVTPVGTPVMANVVNGMASANYTLPGGTGAKPYTIQAVYSDPTNFLGASDITHHLTVSGAPTTTTASVVSAPFSASSQSIPLSAQVTSPNGSVNEGSVTFTVLKGAVVIGAPTPANVANGSATTNFNLPAGTLPGSYTLQAVYTDPANFLGSTDNTQHVIVSSSTTTTASNASAVYSSAAGQNVTLNAAVASPGGAVSEGVVTFTILSGATPIGVAATATVTAGAASATYSLPAGSAPGVYTVQAVYSDAAAAFSGSGDSTHKLTVGQATTSSIATNSSAIFSTSGQSVTLVANVSSPAGTVNEGVVTFVLLNGNTPVSSPVSVSVAGGAATAGFPLPAGTPAGSYTIQATYNGTSNFQGSSDSTHHLIVAVAADAIAAASTSMTYNAIAQTAPLTASVTSTAGVIGEGTVTFKILAGATLIGAPITTAVSAGVAAAGYPLPAGLSGGVYMIQADYHGVGNFLDQTDVAHTLTISPAAVSNTAASTSAAYNTGAQTVALTAAITSPAGLVNEGTETFKILNGASVLGTPVTINVVNGSASVSYSLPPGVAGGSYVIQATYSGANNFAGAIDSAHQLAVTAAATQTSAANAATLYNTVAQTLALHATVTSGAGVVNEGAETFTVRNGPTVVGSPITVNVANGAANANYTLPAGAAPGAYLIEVEYAGSVNFQAATDSAHHLTISAAAAATAASNSQVVFKTTAQPVLLSASITSTAGTVNEGIETFTILSGPTVIGTATSTNVANGAASVSYTLPAGTAAGTYAIQAAYGGTVNYQSATESAHQLIVNAASTTTTAAIAATTFSGNAQSVPLSATVTSAAGVVNEGTATFTIMKGTTAVGSPVTVNVVGGSASASYPLPAGTSGGSYTIQASFNGTSNFVASSDAAHSLTIAAATTTTTAANASLTVTSIGGAHVIPLTATITSPAGVVGAGVETFKIMNGSILIGVVATQNVANGAASANYTLPAGTGPGSYTVLASYGGSVNFGTSSDNTHHATLTLKSAPGDFDGDGKTDLAVYDQTLSQFTITLSGGGSKSPQFGNGAHTNIPVAGDFDGDGKTDTAIYDQTVSQFFILKSGGGALTPQFGNPAHTNIPVAGDFDGDGKADLAIYDQSASQFFILLSGGGAKTPQFGNPAHVNVPVVGDFDLDGKADIGIYDQSGAQFFILLSGGGASTPTIGNSAHVNVPVAGDYDGDGKTDMGLYDQTAGQFTILLTGGGLMTPKLGNVAHVNIPLLGDYDRDGKTDVGVYDQTAAQFSIMFSGGGSESPMLGSVAHPNVPVPSVYLGAARGKSAATRSMRPSPSSFDLAASAQTFGVSSSSVSRSAVRSAAQGVVNPVSARPAQAVVPTINPWGSL